ncbi:hypothetical protein [Haliscomenobacter hydrossis]|uniref:Uncharacterized protein n=1 Tax=Haliscomenobacter hydrossis (strain ATCC 27775 / DSM 1100 / LMG 10767 / O) TaxID=760192 RepID=F4KUT9_HALH1|nr:hypothetical protein [Haliscomenobacter hydrossis]AEE53492.1 hypothetical protein Halhy_5669 [Haliscomenobacter hydrossis DSM 1100]
MKKAINDSPRKNTERMLNQKTNEDHNQQKPDPEDPNETENDANGEVQLPSAKTSKRRWKKPSIPTMDNINEAKSKGRV